MKSMKMIAATGLVLAGMAATALAQQPGAAPQPAPGAPAATPQRPDRTLSDADRAAFLAARIAGLKAALSLTADQEKHWPAFETALKSAAQDRMAMRTAMMQRREAMRAGTAAPDLMTGLRTMAESQTKRGQNLTKIADAADPLYKSLDDAQKRRFGMMMRRAIGGMGGEGGWREGRHHGGWHGGDRGGWQGGGERGPRQ